MLGNNLLKSYPSGAFLCGRSFTIKKSPFWAAVIETKTKLTFPDVTTEGQSERQPLSIPSTHLPTTRMSKGRAGHIKPWLCAVVLSSRGRNEGAHAHALSHIVRSRSGVGSKGRAFCFQSVPLALFLLPFSSPHWSFVNRFSTFRLKSWRIGLKKLLS